MIAGVALGPTLLGQVAPGVEAFLFPPASRPVLGVLAQLAVSLYMFLVGLSFDREGFRSKARSAVAVSLSGMIVPFLLALAIGPWLVTLPGLFSPGANTAQATLYVGAAMAITAFPMLARIIHERGLAGTPLGTLSLAAGAVDDVCAWIVLAGVLATFGAGPGLAIRAIAGGGGFALLLLLFGGRLLAPLDRAARRPKGLTPGIAAVAIALFALSACLMDVAGVHAVFGGFLLGAVMPRGPLTEGLRRQIEPFASIVLLPIFFTYSGLATRLAMMGDTGLLSAAVILILASILAKGGACWAAARLTGQANRPAIALGALMNARGLMELIIADIGIQHGLIGPPMVAILVLMAIITTAMATPIFTAALRSDGGAHRASPELQLS
jgi:Kef-type K+ transport system membrane component KefB